MLARARLSSGNLGVKASRKVAGSAEHIIQIHPWQPTGP